MNALPTVRTPSNHPKIRATHLDRLAYIYVRQSSPGQVLHNQESQMLQRRLSERAEGLGWRADRIRTIDADQGTSAKTSAGRDGYQELVTEVSLGHVGIIFGWQVSRVARNNSDWVQLMALAAKVDTLVADIDGVYDLLRDLNDRLVLGFKGIMSEAELYWMQQRLDAGRMNKVKRGAYRQGLPTGLVRLEDGRVVKDPDDQVRHAIELVLLKFEELGTCGKVVRYLRKENVLLPRRQTASLFYGRLQWKVANGPIVYKIVKNPAYAGAFAYGRRQVDKTRQIPGKSSTGRTIRPMSDWLHIQRDAYEAYINWEQYVSNQERMAQNVTTSAFEIARGAPREGAALLQGLMRCGHCGHLMCVSYKGGIRYSCTIESHRTGQSSHLRVVATRVEPIVVQAFFDALCPSHIDALEAVRAQQEADYQKLVQQWEERLKRANYEVQMARRSYEAVDPQNRLVAAELERRWEATLRTLQETQEAFDHFERTPRPTALPPDLRAQLKDLSETLPDLWPSLPHDQQKALLRSLIAQVVCRRDTADRLQIRIVWVSGHFSLFDVQYRTVRKQDLGNYAQIVERVEVLWRQGVTDAKIAAQLSGEGFYSARRDHVPMSMVKEIRHEHGWYTSLARCYGFLEYEGCFTAHGLAAELGVNDSWVYNRIRNQTIAPTYVTRHPDSQIYLIRKDPKLLEQLQALLPAS